jgi:hypothetical protein
MVCLRVLVHPSSNLQSRAAYAAALAALARAVVDWQETNQLLLTPEAKQALEANTAWHRAINALYPLTADTLPTDKAGLLALSQQVEAMVDFADKVLRPAKDKTWNAANLRGGLRQLANTREALLFVLERVTYFETQLTWLDNHFPNGHYPDVEGGHVVRGTDIPDLKKGQVNLDVYRYHKPSNIKSRELQAGDIVFEVSGGSKDQALGRNVLIIQEALQQFGIKHCQLASVNL